jgi:small subunit ribosomal protein S16
MPATKQSKLERFNAALAEVQGVPDTEATTPKKRTAKKAAPKAAEAAEPEAEDAAEPTTEG